MANSFKLFIKFMTMNTICKSLNQFTCDYLATESTVK